MPKDRGPWHRGAFDLFTGHGVLGDMCDAPEADRDSAGEPLHPLVVLAGVDHDRLVGLASDGHGRAGHSVNGERLHLQLGERPSHAVGIDNRQTRARPHEQRDHRVDTAALDRHGGVRRAAQVPLQRAQGHFGLGPAWDLLHHHGRGAHLGGRDDERVVIDLVGVQDRDRPVLADRLLHQEPADERVASATGAQDRGPARQIGEVLQS